MQKGHAVQLHSSRALVAAKDAPAMPKKARGLQSTTWSGLLLGAGDSDH